MACTGVAHGDIKPGNILIDKGGDKISCRLIDFGSCVVSGQERVPTRSPPWNAPELHRSAGPDSQLGFKQLSKADLFSLGLVCLHILIPLEQLDAAGLNFVRGRAKSDDEWATIVSGLERAKSDTCSFGKRMIALAERVAGSNDGKRFLAALIEGAILPPHNERMIPSDVLGITSSGNSQVDLPLVADSSSLKKHDGHTVFNIGALLGDLDDTDYLVRKEVAHDIAYKADDSCVECRREYALQASLCREIGLGCQRDEKERDKWLASSGNSPQSLHGLVDKIQEEYEARNRVSADVLEELGIGILQTSDRVQQYQKTGRLSEAETALRQEVDARSHVFGPVHPSLVRFKRELVTILRARNRLHEASDLQEEIVRIVEVAYGPDSSICALEKLTLASIWTSVGRLANAEQVQTEQLQNVIKVLGPDHPDYLSCLIGQANIKMVKGDFQGAEALFRQVIAARIKVLGPDHPVTVQAELDLGYLLLNRGHRIQAMELLDSVARRFGTVLQGDLWLGSNLFLKQAQLMIELGQLELANEKIQEVLAALKRMRVVEPDGLILDAYEIQAQVYHLSLKFQDEEELLRLMLRDVDPSSIRGWMLQIKLARNLGHQGQPTEAASLAQKIIESLGSSPVTTEPFVYLGCVDIQTDLLPHQGPVDRIEQVLTDALETCTRELGSDHAASARAAHMLGAFCSGQRRFAEAEARLLPLLERLGTEPSSSAVAISQELAVSYRELGRFSEAEALCLRAIAWAESLSGSNHPTVHSAQNLLGSVYVRHGRLKEADDVLQRLHDACQSPDIKPYVAANLSKLRSAQDRTAEAVELAYQSYLLSRDASGLSQKSIQAEAVWLRMRFDLEGLTPGLERDVLDHIRRRGDNFGQAHSGRLAMMADLAYWYGLSQRPDDAGRLFHEVEQLGGLGEDQDPLQYAILLGKHADSLFQNGRFDEAEPLELKALGIRRRIYGVDHEVVLTGEQNLSTTLNALNRRSEAEDLLRHVIECREQQLTAMTDQDGGATGRNSMAQLVRKIMYTKNALAGVLFGQEKLGESLALFEEALEIERATAARAPVISDLSQSILVVRQRMAEPEET